MARHTQVTEIPAIATANPQLAERLHKLWETEPGIKGFLGSVDHKEIGIRYIVTSFVFLLLGGVEALILRLQLAQPDLHVLSPEQYNQLFTMHGVSMIFLYAMPVLTGFSNYLWPLLLGARDTALPRVNALSYWLYLFSGLFIYASFLLGHAPNAGWFNYVPYTNRQYNPGPNIDFYSLGMIFLGISTTVSSVNFVVTAMRTRAAGMSINRIPILVWGTLTSSVANLLVVPCVSLAFFLLWLDRNYGTKFFQPQSGGQPLLWQHLFWIFAHPWVYAIVLPAMGMVSDGLPIFCRRPLVGYTLVALSTMATMAIGFGVWTHHMFASGMSDLALSFFSGVSIIIAVPSAVSVFAWIATIWTGRPVFTTAFHYFAGMIALFVIGGVSGFMTGSVPVDWQLTDTYFVVAHLHYVLIGINVFPVVGAIYMWFPKMTGRLLDERIGRMNFWLMFLGFNIAVFPMHITGLLGMPRRVYTYPHDVGWTTWNLITSAGAFLFALGVLLLFHNIAVSLKRGKHAGANPWDGGTLEWAVPSPPPPYNFVVLPSVASRHPLWEDRLDDAPGRSFVDVGLALDKGRQMLGTTVIDAEPAVILQMPFDSYAPLTLAIGTAVVFIGMLCRSWPGVGAGVVITGIALLLWLWPGRLREGSPEAANERRLRSRIMSDLALGHRSHEVHAPALPVGSIGSQASGYFGVWWVIITEASLFVYLLFSYAYCAMQATGPWPPSGPPELGLASADTLILILSSIAVALGEHSIKRGQRARLTLGLAIAFVLGIVFVAIQLKEWASKGASLSSNLYYSFYFTTTGFHMAHVAVGVLILGALTIWSALGKFDAVRNSPVSIGALYWHFVDAVWIVVFTTYYIVPRLR